MNEWTRQHDQAWRALSAAAERVGAHQWALQHARRKRRYKPTEGHRVLVDGMKDLGRGHLTPDEAMVLLQFGEGAEELCRARRWESERRKAAWESTRRGAGVPV